MSFNPFQPARRGTQRYQLQQRLQSPAVTPQQYGQRRAQSMTPAVQAPVDTAAFYRAQYEHMIQSNPIPVPGQPVPPLSDIPAPSASSFVMAPPVAPPSPAPVQIRTVAPQGVQDDYFGEKQLFETNNWTPARYERFVNAHIVNRNYKYVEGQLVRRPQDDGWVYSSEETPKPLYRESVTANAAPCCDWQVYKNSGKYVMRLVWREGALPIHESVQVLGGQVHQAITFVLHNHPAESVKDGLLPPLTYPPHNVVQSVSTMWSNLPIAPVAGQVPPHRVHRSAVIANGAFSQSEATRQYCSYPLQHTELAAEVSVPEPLPVDHFQFSGDIKQLSVFVDVFNRWPARYCVKESYRDFNSVVNWALVMRRASPVAEVVYCVRCCMFWQDQLSQPGEKPLVLKKKSEFTAMNMAMKKTEALQTERHALAIKQLVADICKFLTFAESKTEGDILKIHKEIRSSWDQVYYKHSVILHHIFLMLPIWSAFPFGVPYRALITPTRYESRHMPISYLLMEGPHLASREVLLTRISYITKTAVVKEDVGFKPLSDLKGNFQVVAKLSKAERKALFVRSAVWTMISKQFSDFRNGRVEMANSCEPLIAYLRECGIERPNWTEPRTDFNDLARRLGLHVVDYASRKFPPRILTLDLAGEFSAHTVSVPDCEDGGRVPEYVQLPPDDSVTDTSASIGVAVMQADEPELPTCSSSPLPSHYSPLPVTAKSTATTSIVPSAAQSTVAAIQSTSSAAAPVQQFSHSTLPSSSTSLPIMPFPQRRKGSVVTAEHNFNVTVTQPLCLEIFPLVLSADKTGFVSTLDITPVEPVQRVLIAADAPVKALQQLLLATKGIVEQYRYQQFSNGLNFEQLRSDQLVLPGRNVRKDSKRASLAVKVLPTPIQLPVTFIVGYWKGKLSLPTSIRPLPEDEDLHQLYKEWRVFCAQQLGQPMPNFGTKPKRTAHHSQKRKRLSKSAVQSSASSIVDAIDVDETQPLTLQDTDIQRLEVELQRYSSTSSEDKKTAHTPSTAESGELISDQSNNSNHSILNTSAEFVAPSAPVVHNIDIDASPMPTPNAATHATTPVGSHPASALPADDTLPVDLNNNAEASASAPSTPAVTYASVAATGLYAKPTDTTMVIARDDGMDTD